MNELAIAASAEPLVELKNIEVRTGHKALVEGISLSVSKEEIVTIIGPNGAGKTTLIKTVLGLIKPSSGRVSRKQGLKIGYMPQRLMVDRNMPLTVRRFLGLAGRFEPGARKRVLEETGISHIIDLSIHDISGGEWQRMLLARALLRQPDLLVLDEPVEAVDVAGQAELYQLIGDIKDRHECGVLMVSHDLHLVMSETDRVVCINTHLCCAGHPDVVSQDPSYVALFGPSVAENLALYRHSHDHEHNIDGSIHHHHDHRGHPHG